MLELGSRQKATTALSEDGGTSKEVGGGKASNWNYVKKKKKKGTLAMCAAITRQGDRCRKNW